MAKKSKNIFGGGAQTNKNGLEFEQLTDLAAAINKHGEYEVVGHKVYLQKEEIGFIAPKHKLYKLILEPNGIDWETKISKKILPDDVLFLYENKQVFIIEKKFQKTAGSVDEKLQTCDFKLKTYKKLFGDITANVDYIYVLNDWFKQPMYKDVLEYIQSVGCKYFFNVLPMNEVGL